MNLIPRSLGISAPKGKDVYEVYLVVKSRPGILAKTTEIMRQRNIDILEVHSQVSDDKQLAYEFFYVEMGNAAVTINQLIAALKAKEFVIEARVEAKHETCFESMMFPITSGGHYRMFVLGGKSWIALIHALLKTFGSAGNTILHNEGVTIAQETVEMISRRFNGTSEREILLKNFKQLFGAAGHGIAEISGGSEEFVITISNTIASEYDEPVMDQFLVGIVRGGLEKIFASEYKVENLRYEEKKIKFALVRKG